MVLSSKSAFFVKTNGEAPLAIVQIQRISYADAVWGTMAYR
jgi:hypothetical protein